MSYEFQTLLHILVFIFPFCGCCVELFGTHQTLPGIIHYVCVGLLSFISISVHFHNMLFQVSLTL